ncbi:uncharacterized protein N7511_009385 [Penicillium nucicola]|uniref:uncharacterized protein n=1 Tax=Penicillium nucicola TaxID=1850975 RepID=UPI002545AF1D|nr:uncharacterized protein N7511_009385 [Penicillium nucicola]KAJ5747689.1 hypothetical protein N7511_009385 [Penicillium nucicola]
MKRATVVFTLCLYSLQALVLASPSPSSLDGYDLFIPSWEVQVTPSSEPIVLNGTVEELHTKLLQLNPKWDEDFAEIETEDDALVERDFDLEKRTDFAGSKYNCFGRWGRCDSIPVNQGITYLRKLNGNPRAAAGPSSCARVSCSYKAAIYWCNDSKSKKTLNSFGSIADGAKYINTKCVLGSGLSRYTAGQVFHKSNWNVIVQEDKC